MATSHHNFIVSDLRQRPEYFDTISSRIWNAWWQRRGYALCDVASRLTECMGVDPMPMALVAHEGLTFMGTALVVASDMDERSQYTPWVAAVWVDPEYRNQGVGAALVDRAAGEAFAAGVNRVYLCATREKRDFYLNRSWTQIEEDVRERLLAIMIRDRV